MKDVKQEELYIQLSKTSILKFGLRDEEGKPTGEYLYFDPEDFEYPLRLQDAQKKHLKNVDALQIRLLIIDKQEDKKGKYIFSWKEEEKQKAYVEFCAREEEVVDLIFGQGATRKILNGRKPYLTMYIDLKNMFEEQILPVLEKNKKNLTDLIEKKYSNNDSEVLK